MAAAQRCADRVVNGPDVRGADKWTVPVRLGVLQARLEDAARTRQWRSPETVLAWMDDAEQLALVVHNTCPFCRAEPGDLCHDLAGMATYSPHPERCGDGAIPLRGPRRARR